MLTRLWDKATRGANRYLLKPTARIAASMEAKRLAKRIADRKEAMAASGFAYTATPQVTAVVQFFNQRRQIAPLIARLREAFEEIIIIDDGSIDGSCAEWARTLTRPNEFLLRCNDLYEVRTYDRAIRMARGWLVCLLQDDDLPPPGDKWVRDAVMLFERFPDLVILGGRQGFELMLPEAVSDEGAAAYRREGDIAGCPGINRYRIFDKPCSRVGDSKIPFMFTTFINRAPMFVRRDAFLELGGIRQEFAPYQCDDIDCCLRAWLAGKQVGFYASGFRHFVSGGGMRLHNQKDIFQIQVANWRRIYRTYSDVIARGELASRVEQCNRGLGSKPTAQSPGERNLSPGMP